MQERFNKYLEELLEGKHPARILLAVSGGMDSMSMFSLFRRTVHSIAIAHCNFQLRGEESEGDEQLVKKLAEEHNIPFYSKRFDTRQLQENSGKSVQMVARELRYAWFEALMEQEEFDYLAVAHHQDDTMETFFINLLRGTGLAGMTGIPPRNGRIIRPLLGFNREEIAVYAKQQQLAYREDSSNRSVKYLRNALRLEIIPVLMELQPALRHVLLKEMEQFGEVFQVFRQAVMEKMEQLVIQEQEQIRIPKKALLSLSPLKPYLFEYLRQYGFNSADVDDIVEGLTATTHAEYHSPTHRLIRESAALILLQNVIPADEETYQVTADCRRLERPLPMLITICDKQGTGIEADPSKAFIDAGKLDFPLELRRWRKGDRFYPLGMKGAKKLSDFFTDEKFTAIQKEKTWLLTSAGKIVWVAGHRLDERFRVGEGTARIYKIELK